MEPKLWFIRYSVFMEHVRIDDSHEIIEGINARSALFNFMLDESKRLDITMRDIKILAMNRV